MLEELLLLEEHKYQLLSREEGVEKDQHRHIFQVTRQVIILVKVLLLVIRRMVVELVELVVVAVERVIIHSPGVVVD